MLTIILTILLVGVFFIALSVRLLFLKDGKFKGTCASQNPFLNKEGVKCGYCGKTVSSGDECNKEIQEESEVDKIIKKFS